MAQIHHFDAIALWQGSVSCGICKVQFTKPITFCNVELTLQALFCKVYLAIFTTTVHKLLP